MLPGLVTQLPEEQRGSGGSAGYQEVDVESLALVQPRSVGVAHVRMSAVQELGMPEILTALGRQGCATGSRPGLQYRQHGCAGQCAWDLLAPGI